MKIVAIVLGVLLALLLGAGGVAWYAGVPPFAPAAKSADQAATAPVAPPGEHYVSLDKLVVMTRGDGAQGRPRYLAMDLVFAVADKKAADRTEAQLPLLRSVAHRTLAGYRAEQLRQMQVDDVVKVLKDAYAKTYGDADEMPFNQVLIARMMLE